MNPTAVDLFAPQGATLPRRSQTSDLLDVPDHLVWAVLSTVLCFTPTGVVAVVHAARVKPLLAAGRVVAARRASTLAARFCWVSLAVTVSFLLTIYLGAVG